MGIQGLTVEGVFWVLKQMVKAFHLIIIFVVCPAVILSGSRIVIEFTLSLFELSAPLNKSLETSIEIFLSCMVIYHLVHLNRLGRLSTPKAPPRPLKN